MANLLRLLALAPGLRVLDVGAGSGRNTALLTHLVAWRNAARAAPTEISRHGGYRFVPLK